MATGVPEIELAVPGLPALIAQDIRICSHALAAVMQHCTRQCEAEGHDVRIQFAKTATLKLEHSCSSHTERGSLQARAGQVPIN